MAISITSSPDKTKIQWSDNPLWWIIHRAAAGTSYVQAFITFTNAAGAVFVSPAISAYFDNNNNCSFRLDPILKAFLSPDIPLNDYTTGVNTCKTNNGKYNIVFKETEPVTLVIDTTINDNGYSLIMGGVSFDKNFNDHTLYDRLTYTNRWLTWQPNSLVNAAGTIPQDAPLWPVNEDLFLSVLVPNYTATYFIRQTMHFSDGSTSHQDYAFGNSGSWVYWMVSDIASATSGVLTPDYFTIGLYATADTGATTPLSQVLTYVIDNNSYRTSKFFMVANSLGGFDKIWFNGEDEQDMTYIQDDYEKAYSPLTSLPIGANGIANMQETVKVICSTGWKTRAEIDHIRELLLSAYVYELKGGSVQQNTRYWYPVNFDRKNVKLLTSKQTAFALQLTYTYLYTNLRYTPQSEDIWNLGGGD